MMETALVILLLPLCVMMISFYVYETERKLLNMEEKLLKQVEISNTAERKLLQMKEDILIQEVILDRAERKLLHMEEKLLKQEVILDAAEMKLLNMEKKINKEEVISNTVERELLLQIVEKLVKQAVILNTAGSVAFTASLSELYVVDSNEIIKFDKVWMNIGDGYDPESGVFTAPETGLYMVSSTMRMDNGLKCYLSKNDIKKVGLHGTGTLNTMMMLQNGDRIYIKNYGDGYHARLFGYHLSMFSAFLIKS